MGKKIAGFINMVSEMFFDTNVSYGKYEAKEPYSDYIAATALNIDMKSFTKNPIISIVLNGNEKQDIDATVSSVQAQTYSGWELVIISNDAYNYADSRIMSFGKTSDISQAVSMCSGEYLFFMDSGDTLVNYALAALVESICKHPDADAFFCDEDIWENGVRSAPTFKSVYSPDTLLSYNCIGKFFAVSSNLYFRCEGLDGFDPSSEYAYTLKACDAASHVVHIDNVMYTRKSAPQQVPCESGIRAINSTLRKKGIDGFATSGLFGSSFKVHYIIPESYRCEIFVYGATTAEELRNCLEIIEDVTFTDAYSITVMSKNTTDTKLLRYENALTNNSAANVRRFSPNTSFAKMCNDCAFSSNADLFVFLPVNTVPLMPDWINALAELALRRDAGTISPLVITPDERILSAGNVIGTQGWWNVPYYMEQIKYTDKRMNEFINVMRNVSLSNMDCFMVSNGAFSELNGFDESFIGKAAIADLSIRLMWKYRKNIYTPFVRMQSAPAPFTEPNYDDRIRTYDVLRSFLIHGDAYYSRAYDMAYILPTVAKTPYQAIKLNPMPNQQ